MKKYLPIAASVLLLAACSEKPGYEITGTVSNSDLNGKYVYLYEYGVKDAAPLDSALVQNGSFALKGTQNAPALRTLRFSEEVDRKSTRLNSSHKVQSRMPSSA